MKKLVFIGCVFLPALTMAQMGTDQGNGGDDVGIEFAHAFQAALANIKKYKISDLEEIANIDFRKKLSNIKISVVTTPLTVNIEQSEQNSVAMNYPSQQLITINRYKWLGIQNQYIKQGLALHEILGLLGLESSGDYCYSSKYLLAFNQDIADIHKKYYVGKIKANAINTSDPKEVAIAAFNADPAVKTAIREALDGVADPELEAISIIQVGDFERNDESNRLDFLVILGISLMAEHWESTGSITAKVTVVGQFNSNTGDFYKYKVKTVKLVDLK